MQPSSEPSPPMAFPIHAADSTSAAMIASWCRNQSAGLGLSVIASKLIFRWNFRMRTAAGRAFWPTCRIDLNPALIQHGQEEIWRTLLHELAHLVAYARHGTRISPHGTEWNDACSTLGIPGESTKHRLSLHTRRRMARPYTYMCTTCGQSFTRTRKITRKLACSACCKQYNHGKYHPNFALICLTHPKK